MKYAESTMAALLKLKQQVKDKEHDNKQLPSASAETAITVRDIEVENERLAQQAHALLQQDEHARLMLAQGRAAYGSERADMRRQEQEIEGAIGEMRQETQQSATSAVKLQVHLEELQKAVGNAERQARKEQKEWERERQVMVGGLTQKKASMETERLKATQVIIICSNI